MMNFKSLRIERGYYGKDNGKLIGTLTFDNTEAETTLKLSNEKAQQMLNIVAGPLVENAHELSDMLTGQITNPAQLLEGEVL